MIDKLFLGTCLFHEVSLPGSSKELKIRDKDFAAIPRQGRR